ncbi:CLUMA_CG019378, isoform A [Clunio marinus]|uniref:CLUMA_CG019378, isoform A n=1 Tax=Clunio marinus TaxID=568069 RepID=A0A1J1J1C5_9DIPT|nr:CLUMA_CG019378, isoform A [Clunio marinus]
MELRSNAYDDRFLILLTKIFENNKDHEGMELNFKKENKQSPKILSFAHPFADKYFMAKSDSRHCLVYTQ